MRGIRVVALLSFGALLLVFLGFLFGQQFESPEQAATRVKPEVIPITDPLSDRVLARTILLRGRVEPQALLAVTVPQVSPTVITSISLAPGDRVSQGTVALEVAGRPILVLSGLFPAWRDFEYQMEPGPDVRQLQEALSSLGFYNEEFDSRYGVDTGKAVRALYDSVGYTVPIRNGHPSLPQAEVFFLPGGMGSVEVVSAGVGDRLEAGSIQVGTIDKRILISSESDSSAALRPGMKATVFDESREVLMETVITAVGELETMESQYSFALNLDSQLDFAAKTVLIEVELDATNGEVLSASPAAVFFEDSGQAYIVALIGKAQVQISVDVGFAGDDWVQIITDDPRLTAGVDLILNPQVSDA